LILDYSGSMNETIAAAAAASAFENIKKCHHGPGFYQQIIPFVAESI
jgi:hypothetical protein